MLSKHCLLSVTVSVFNVVNVLGDHAWRKAVLDHALFMAELDIL
jgi:hypothetical protein